MEEEVAIYIVSLPRGQENLRPDPFPGSDKAFDQGCTCPISQPWPGQLAFAEGCPIHQLVAAEETQN